MRKRSFLFFVFTNIVAVYTWESEIHIKTYKEPNGGQDLKCRFDFDRAYIRKDQPFNVFIHYAPIYRPRCVVGAKHLNNLTSTEYNARYYISKNFHTDFIKNGDNVTCSFNTNNCSDQYSLDQCHYYLPEKKYYYNDDRVECTFKVYLLDKYVTDPKGNLRVNGEIMVKNKFKSGNEGTYQYRDRSATLFKCTRDSEGYLKFVYRPKGADPISTEFQVTNYIEWYMKLMSEHHEATLECHIADITMTYTTVLLLHLENYDMKHKHQSLAPGFEVNELVLQKYKHIGTYNHFNYYYYDQETLIINFLIDDTNNQDLKCIFHGELTSDAPQYIETFNMYTYNITFKKEYNNTVLSCSLHKQTYDLSLIYNAEEPLKGLSKAHIKMNYTKERSEYNHIITTLYEYNNDSPLTCNTYGWKYKKGEVYCPEHKLFEDVRPFTCTFNLINNYSRSTVECSPNRVIELVRTKQILPLTNYTAISQNDVYKKQRSYADIVRGKKKYDKQVDKNTMLTHHQNPIITTATPITVIPIVNNKVVNTVTEDPDQNTSNLDKDSDDSGYVTHTALIIVGVLLFIIFTISVIILLHLNKKRKSQNTQSVMDYRNLPQHNEGPMPTPSQWTDNLTDLYAKPVPKSQRKTKDPNEPTYEAIGHGVEVKKSLTYANIETNSSLHDTEKETYVNIANSKMADTNNRNFTDDYINVSNSNYVNVSHSVEPTYCEVNARK